jgi:hypothetical protein
MQMNERGCRNARLPINRLQRTDRDAARRGCLALGGTETMFLKEDYWHYIFGVFVYHKEKYDG